MASLSESLIRRQFTLVQRDHAPLDLINDLLIVRRNHDRRTAGIDDLEQLDDLA